MSLEGDFTTQKCAVVFVHLGENPSPTLLYMATFAKKQFSACDLYLITDHASAWKAFPGTIIKYDESQRSSIFLHFLGKNRELEGISGGYWLYTLERLFALRVLVNQIPQGVPIVHLESDVMSFLDEFIIKEMLKYPELICIPKYSDARGIASILFAKNTDVLSSGLERLENLLLEYSNLANDMDFLGLGLQLGILHELSSRPIVSNSEKDAALLFDGAAIGQYFFGQDPLHNGGRRISGYINPDYGYDVTSGHFSISSTEHTEPKIMWEAGGNCYLIANLHVHSKELPPAISGGREYWTRIIDSANLKTQITSTQIFEDVIHSRPLSPLNRIRRARKIGFVKQLKRSIKYRTGF